VLTEDTRQGATGLITFKEWKAQDM